MTISWWKISHLFPPFCRNDCDSSGICVVHQNSNIAQVVKSNLASRSSQNSNSGKKYEDFFQKSETVTISKSVNCHLM